ncbi:helix-turn-helix domain-containing protein [Rosistilla oblonga]|uniref:Helix-turn-helix domain protein n=1 Tax=Rosistilla oblonga TaxID=2527990 RepID=A0A518IW49_9BACT|nr:helix-turn-helix domain-containing protein [Rosistilla oblonga]QDV57313.1 Helix-turn-helix domain protein [Rosistilla oblonga]
MANQFVPLEEAAQLLGISTEQLVTMRSDGEVRAFKDGSSWKFPQSEIDRLLAEQQDDGDSTQLFGGGMPDEPLSDAELSLDSGLSGTSDQEPAGESEIQELGSSAGSDEDLLLANDASNDTNAAAAEQIAAEDAAASSDESIQLSSGSASELDELSIADSGDDLIGGPEGDSDVDLSLDLGLAEDDPSDAMNIDLSLSEKALSDPSDIDLSLSEKALSDPSDIDLSLSEKALSDPSDIDLSLPEPATGGSDQELSGADISDLGSGLNLAEGSDLLGGSGPGSSGSGSESVLSDDDDDDDLVISDDDELVLDSAGSDISVVGGSGINLMTPSDSGLSLESEPLDLAGSSISAIDLSSELSDPASGSGSGRGPGSSGSLVDFKADEEFQLSPGGIGLEADDDSASQVIEIEDSQSFGDAMELGGAEMLSGEGEAAGWDQADGSLGEDVQDIEAAEVDEVSIDENAVVPGDASVAANAGAAAYEVPFSIWNVMSLAGILMMLLAGGVISADLMRNLWTDSVQSADVSSLTSAILKAMGMDA